MYKILKKKVSKFSHWMGYQPPGSLTIEGWRLFNEEFKKYAPVRYWFREFMRLRYPIIHRFKDVKDWLKYRTTNRNHIIKTGLEPGWYELDTKLLHGSFSMLKDFVEIDNAWRFYIFHEEENGWFEKHMPFYWGVKEFRRPDLGIRHFEWAATLDDPSLPPRVRADEQAVNAREVLSLYNWWVKERPSRKLPDLPNYDNQGFGRLGFTHGKFNKQAPDYIEYQRISDICTDLEEKWNIEDEEMLIRLVKLRKSLWT